MSEHLRCILESKRALRTRLAALPFVERFRCGSNSGTALCDSTLQPPRLVAQWRESVPGIPSPSDYESIIARLL